MSKKSKKDKKSKSTLDRDAKRSGVNSLSKIGKKEYEAHIFKLQVELVKLQEWVKATNRNHLYFDRSISVADQRTGATRGPSHGW